MPKPSILISYYPIRGKAQVCRLLCQYLRVRYADRLYSLTQWDKQKKQKFKNTSLKELPFLEQGNFRITGSIPMCMYIIDRFSNGQLFGKNLKDQGLVDMYLWTIDAMSGIIKMNCQKKSSNQIKHFKQVQWRNVVAPKLQKYQDFSKQNEWFIGYLTIIDFSIYELMKYIQLIFEQKIQEFPKLKAITQRLGEIPQIKAYEESTYAIKQLCPTSLLKQIRIESKQIVQEKEMRSALTVN